MIRRFGDLDHFISLVLHRHSNRQGAKSPSSNTIRLEALLLFKFPFHILDLFSLNVYVLFATWHVGCIINRLNVIVFSENYIMKWSNQGMPRNLELLNYLSVLFTVSPPGVGASSHVTVTCFWLEMTGFVQPWK